jgi:hypothetical protein
MLWSILQSKKGAVPSLIGKVWVQSFVVIHRFDANNFTVRIAHHALGRSHVDEHLVEGFHHFAKPAIVRFGLIEQLLQQAGKLGVAVKVRPADPVPNL